MIAIISSDAIGIIIDAVMPRPTGVRLKRYGVTTLTVWMVGGCGPATAEWAVFEESAAMRVPGHVCKGKGDE